jgi:serine/threonine-protein kinase
MGEVFLAHQISLDRPVALKILSPRLAKNPSFVERFLSEARAAGKLSHENIVAGLDAGESGGRYYFVMEYVEGATLQEVIGRDGPIPPGRAFEIAKQIATGLRHAHRHGLIHRDIKPANVILTPENVAKICDLGLARELDTDTTLTLPGTVQSSPAYASPEQCRGERELDHRTDMYSLGVTLFEMLTGNRPFHAETSGGLFIKHATETPPSPQSLNPSLSSSASQLVLRLLKKDRKNRFETYDDLLEAIEAVQKSKELPRRRIPAALPGRGAPPKRSRWLGRAAAILLLLAAGAGVFIVRAKLRNAQDPSQGQAPAVDSQVESLVLKVAALEKRLEEHPSEIPTVRARWKELGEQFRATRHFPLVVQHQVEFEARVTEWAESAGRRALGETERLWKMDRLGEALQVLRGFPQGFEGTQAQARVAARASELAKGLEDRLQNGRESVKSLLASGNVEGARRALETFRSLVTVLIDGKAEFLQSDYRDEHEKLLAQIEEATRKEQAKAEQDAKLAAKASTTPRAPKIETVSSVPDYVRVLRSRSQRSDPGERARALTGLRAMAPRSSLARAGLVFLTHDERFWGLVGDRLKLKTEHVDLDLEGLAQSEEGKNTVFQAHSGHRVVLQKDGKISLNSGSWIVPVSCELSRNLPSPVLKILEDYLAAVALERVDQLSPAEHQGFFVLLAKKSSDLGERPKDALTLFALAHADELLGQNARLDPEGVRLCHLECAKKTDLWGPAPVVNRMALARLLLGPGDSPDLRRAQEGVLAAQDFPSRFLSALALLREKEFEPMAALAQWKKLPGMAPDTTTGKFCEEVVERLKKALVCEGCAGQGKYPCKKCMALGIVECERCKGTGHVKEGPDGVLTYSGVVPCPACKQKGKLTCPICLGGRIAKCEKCDGKKTKKVLAGSDYQDLVGSHLCSSCDGSGSVFSRIAFPCPECKGLGRFPSK